MRPYEIMIVFNPSMLEGDEGYESIVKRFADLITQNGGTIDNIDGWGKRRLAYEIEDQTEGYYVVIHFQATGETVTEVERVLRITGEAMRYLTVRKEEE